WSAAGGTGPRNDCLPGPPRRFCQGRPRRADQGLQGVFPRAWLPHREGQALAHPAGPAEVHHGGSPVRRNFRLTLLLWRGCWKAAFISPPPKLPSTVALPTRDCGTFSRTTLVNSHRIASWRIVPVISHTYFPFSMM